MSLPLYIPLYVTLGGLSLPYIMVKNQEVLKSIYIPPLFIFWPLALPLSYTEDLKTLIKELQNSNQKT